MRFSSSSRSTSLSGHFNLGPGVSAYLATIIFGVVLIVAMIAAPNGIQGGVRWAWAKAKSVRARVEPDEPSAAERLARGPSDRSSTTAQSLK